MPKKKAVQFAIIATLVGLVEFLNLVIAFKRREAEKPESEVPSA